MSDYDSSQRLHDLLFHLGLNQTQFAEQIGVNSSNLNKLFTGKRPLGRNLANTIALKFGVNPQWLLTGEGEMTSVNGIITQINNTNNMVKSPLAENVTNVPIVHIDSVGGIHSDNDINSPEYIEGYIPIVGARKGDLAIYQSGDSMSPTIPSGAILQIREVVGWREYIGYGDVFVLLLDDERRITKAIYRYDEDPANYYLCVSYNSMVSDEPLPKSIIRRVWKVIRIFINKGW